MDKPEEWYWVRDSEGGDEVYMRQATSFYGGDLAWGDGGRDGDHRPFDWYVPICRIPSPEDLNRAKAVLRDLRLHAIYVGDPYQQEFIETALKALEGGNETW